MTTPSYGRLTRDTRHKVVAGVCSGLARRFGLSRGGLRAAFVVSCVLPGPQFIAYVVLWALMPADDRY
jgi:phage shock protein PspC (stress-responsive transcriptional regulator)